MTSGARGATVCFRQVRKTYRTGAGVSFQAIAGVSLEVPAGQAVAITGRSGSGKSTLLHLAGGMDVADSGRQKSKKNIKEERQK